MCVVVVFVYGGYGVVVYWLDVVWGVCCEGIYVCDLGWDGYGVVEKFV